MKLWLLLYLFAALVATANTLTCVCTEAPGCEFGTCSLLTPTGICITVAEENNLVAPTSSGVFRNCQPGSVFCDEGVSVTLGGGLFFRIIITCCNTDNCNAAPLELPPKNLTENGVHCPSCSASDSASCEPTETMNCTGAENHCITMSGYLAAANDPSSVSSFAAAGCSSDTACSMPLNENIGTGAVNFLFKSIECSPTVATTSG